MQTLDTKNGFIKKTIQQRFSASFMSDAKWVKLLKMLSTHDDLIQNCKVKLIWDDNLRDFWLQGKSYNYDFYQHAMEAMISGQPTGFYSYKELEFIKFTNTNQNVDEIIRLINAVGQFELAHVSGLLRLYAYK